jgi:hypothetical protein
VKERRREVKKRRQPLSFSPSPVMAMDSLYCLLILSTPDMIDEIPDAMPQSIYNYRVIHAVSHCIYNCCTKGYAPYAVNLTLSRILYTTLELSSHSTAITSSHTHNTRMHARTHALTHAHTHTHTHTHLSGGGGSGGERGEELQASTSLLLPAALPYSHFLSLNSLVCSTNS